MEEIDREKIVFIDRPGRGKQHRSIGEIFIDAKIVQSFHWVFLQPQ